MLIYHKGTRVYVNDRFLVDLQNPYKSIRDRRIRKAGVDKYFADYGTLKISLDANHYKFLVLHKDKASQCNFIYNHAGIIYPTVAAEVFTRYIPDSQELLHYVTCSTKFLIERLGYTKVFVDDERLSHLGEFVMSDITHSTDHRLQLLINKFGPIPANKLEKKLIPSINPNELKIPELNPTDKVLCISLSNKHYSGLIATSFPAYDITPLAVFNIRCYHMYYKDY